MGGEVSYREWSCEQGGDAGVISKAGVLVVVGWVGGSGGGEY